MLGAGEPERREVISPLANALGELVWASCLGVSSLGVSVPEPPPPFANPSRASCPLLKRSSSMIVFLGDDSCESSKICFASSKSQGWAASWFWEDSCEPSSRCVSSLGSRDWADFGIWAPLYPPCGVATPQIWRTASTQLHDWVSSKGRIHQGRGHSVGRVVPLLRLEKLDFRRLIL